MRNSHRTVALLALMLTMPALAVPVHAEPATAADLLRRLLSEEAAAHGLDPAMVLAQPLTLALPASDGSISEVTLALGDWIDLLAQGPSSDASGIAGTAELMVGDTLHLYLNLALGSALAYKVTTSKTLPSTPPIVLPPPATLLFFDVGGPMRNIRGSYLVGLHTAGTLVGSNVDTAGGSGLPVYVPVLTSGIVGDRKIDFVGHAIVAQGQFCIFGICIALGVLLGTGAAQFDGPNVFPTLP